MSTAAVMSASAAAALDLHAQGFALLPLDGKVPHAGALVAVYSSPEWTHLRERRASPPEIAAWFEHDPAAGVGIIVRAGLVVVDVDLPGAFGEQHPATPCVRTARGWHLYFAGDVPGVHRRPWGEVRGTGSYVVAPPSVHESGHRYAWTLAPRDVALAPLPTWATPTSSRRAGTRTYVGPSARSTAARPEHNPATVAAAMAAMNRPDALDGSTGRTREVRCLLPEHWDTRPSAGLYRSRDGAGAYRYHCHGCGADLSLARLFASITSGATVPDLIGPTAARWLARLWHEAGVRRAPIPAVPIPADVSASARRLASGFLLLAAVRAAAGDGDPVPYTIKFAAGWCGLTCKQARTGLDDLRRRGWLRPTGPSRRGIGFLYPLPEPERSACSVARNSVGASRRGRSYCHLDQGSRPWDRRTIRPSCPRRRRG